MVEALRKALETLAALIIAAIIGAPMLVVWAVAVFIIIVWGL